MYRWFRRWYFNFVFWFSFTFTIGCWCWDQFIIMFKVFIVGRKPVFCFCFCTISSRKVCLFVSMVLKRRVEILIDEPYLCYICGVTPWHTGFVQPITPSAPLSMSAPTPTPIHTQTNTHPCHCHPLSLQSEGPTWKQSMVLTVPLVHHCWRHL